MDTYDKFGRYRTIGEAGGVGPEGPPGSPGGLPGGFTLLYAFDNGTSAAGIGPGEVRVNNSVLANVTEIYVHETDRDAISVAGSLSQLGAGDLARLFKESDS